MRNTGIQLRNIMVATRYFLIGLMLFVTPNVFAADEDEMTSCLEFFNPEGLKNMCCQTFENVQEHIFKNTKECFKDDSAEWTCADAECILKKTDMLKGNQIDDEAAMKFYNKLENDFPKEKSIIQRVKNECLDGKYEAYPPEDECPAVKFFVCSFLNSYLECDSWKSLEVCSQMADNAKKCKAALGE